jgi:ribulose-phosphate 3-epimerase
MQLMICPSMLAAPMDHLKDLVCQLDQAGADIFHIDIMDGVFVPNFGMGLSDLTCIRANTSKRVDVHLMISRPSEYVATFAELGVSTLFIHSESGSGVSRTMESIRQHGMKVGLAISPETGIECIREILPLCDSVLVMTVNPGFGGQKFLQFTMGKIAELGSLKDKYGFTLFVDGNIDADKIPTLASVGVEGFIVGTGLFSNQYSSLNDAMTAMRQL